MDISAQEPIQRDLSGLSLAYPVGADTYHTWEGRVGRKAEFPPESRQTSTSRYQPIVGVCVNRILALGFALNQVLSCTDPARLNGMAQAAPWRRPGTLTAGIIRTGWNRIIQGIGIQAIFSSKSEIFRREGRQGDVSGGQARPVAA